MGIHLNGSCVVKWKHLFWKHLLFSDVFRPADGGGTMADRVKAVTQEGKPGTLVRVWLQVCVWTLCCCLFGRNEGSTDTFNAMFLQRVYHEML